MQEYFFSTNIKIRRDEPLCDHSTIRIGGPATYAAFPETKEELSTLIKAAISHDVRYIVVGNGSNLLFDDAGFDGLIVFTSKMRTIKWENTVVRAECGASLTALSREAASRGLSGLEFAYGIPGTIGGAVYMNAGAYGSEISRVLVSSAALSPSGEPITRTNAEHAFSYRSSIYQTNDEIILDAVLRLNPGDPADILARSEENLKMRREKQPLSHPNLGSIFKRPKNTFAGLLIEGAGLKGFAIGGACVSEKHAGFIINRGGATASDVLRLIEHIRTQVQQQYGILLELEIQHIRYHNHSAL